MASGDELSWGSLVRFLHGRGQTAIINLEKGNFVKIRSDAFAILQEALSNGSSNITATLNEQERVDFLDLVGTLRRKKFLIDKSNVGDTISESALERYLDSPKIVYYAVTKSCNLTCPFCYADAEKRVGPYRGDTPLSLQIIDRLASINAVNLVLSGGEPFLREDIFEIVEFAKKKNLFVGVATNGTLIGPSQASRLRSSGADYIQISVESHNEAEHDLLRGKGTFKKCLAAIRLLKEQGYGSKHIYITATTTQKNIETLPQYAAFADGLGVTPGTSFFQSVGRGRRNKAKLACSEKQMLDLVLSRMKEKKEAVTAACVDRPSKQIDGALIPRIINSCGLGNRTLGIREDGTVVPCHLFFSSAKHDIGSILDDSILRKLSSWANSLPTIDGIDECKDCNVRYFCANGCWANVYWSCGDFGRRNPYCNFYKNYYSAVLWNLGLDSAMDRIYMELKGLDGKHTT